MKASNLRLCGSCSLYICGDVASQNLTLNPPMAVNPGISYPWLI